MRVLILFSFLICNLLFAEDITEIKKGEVAATSGFLVPPDKMKELRQINEDKKVLEKKVILLSDLQVNLQDQIAIQKNIANDLRQDVRTAEMRTNLFTVGGFAVGVAITTAIAYGLVKTIK